MIDYLSSNFWAAIAGALVGGAITIVAQVITMRAERCKRREDQKNVQQALGNSLLFKMIKIHSNAVSILDYLDRCYKRAAQKSIATEPWQIVVAMANPPEPITFTSEEMAMLLGLKDDHVFNMVMIQDVAHNSLMDAVRTLAVERKALGDRLGAATIKGEVIISTITREQEVALGPQIVIVNSLIEAIQRDVDAGVKSSRTTLEGLHKVLGSKLGLMHKLTFKLDTAKSD